MSKRVLALILGLLFAALITAAAFIASTYEDSANAYIYQSKSFAQKQ